MTDPRIKKLTGPLPGAISPEEGREMDKRLPPATTETDPMVVNKKAKPGPASTPPGKP